MQLTPWTSEPEVGQGFAYMVRASSLGGTSREGFQYPQVGYVECDKWDPGNILDGHCGGLWGFLHGKGIYDVVFRLYPNPLWQLLIVDLREVRNERLDQSCRVPRAWVKASGTPEQLLKLLRGEDSWYSLLVACAMDFCISAATIE